MKRPAFQFYTADWQGNSKLRRCSHAHKGIWVDVMCLMHDSDEYGVLRWPLEEIAQAVGCTPRFLRELAAKDVLKGAEAGVTMAAFIYTPRHAGKDGTPVTLLPEQEGPIWYSSRMVRDEYVRSIRGVGTRFGDEPKATPTHREGDGASTTTSSSSTKEKTKALSGTPDPRPILEFLNEKTGKHYQPVDANLRLIAARLKEGATETQLRQVIAKKCREWGPDEKMADYLRPKTLFNATNFANYVGELEHGN